MTTNLSEAAVDFLDRAIDIATGEVAPGPADHERRAYQRRPCEGWIAFVEVASGVVRERPLVMRVRDIGAGGLSAACGAPLGAGARGGVLLLRTGGGHAIVGARVVHSSPIDEMDREYGLQFAAIPAPLSLEDFLTPAGHLPDLTPALVS
jgi:hypothetical protein